MNTTRILVVALLWAISGVAGAAAQEWHPPDPKADKKDWVELKSGEWIHGTIDLVRDLKMEFDSDDLDDLVLDWSDIKAFRSPRELTFVFTHERIVTGVSTMRDGVITITSLDGSTNEFPRRELLSVIEGRPKELNYWSAKASIGITARAGNSDQQDMNSILRVKRDATRSRLNANYQGNFSQVDSIETINNHRGNIDFNVFLSRKIYITLASVELYSDRLQNVDYRVTLAVGGGYYLFRQGDIDWSVGIGGGYQVTRFGSVEAGGDEEEKTVSLIPTTLLEWDVTDDLEFDLDYSSQIGVPDPKTSTHHVTGLITIDFYRDIFELSVSLTWDRVENPRANSDGVVPKRDDFRSAFGFAVDL